MTDVDELWFQAHPERNYRMREASPEEIAGLCRDHSAVPLSAAFEIHLLISREGNTRVLFVQPGTSFVSVHDDDASIAQHFASA